MGRAYSMDRDTISMRKAEKKGQPGKQGSAWESECPSRLACGVIGGRKSSGRDPENRDLWP
jgi:hypothetical protein